MFLLSSILIFIECGCADAPRTNKVDEKEVAALVSQLTYGMPEKDAVKFLERNGLANPIVSGDSFGWSDGFDWPSGRATLGLEIAPKQLNPSGAWVNGILKGADLCYPDGKEVPIPLRNAPKH
jgi:hypothetical protein